jgi:S-DNA-T family DNA segregation ATPase FtsK/SpoIIIE
MHRFRFLQPVVSMAAFLASCFLLLACLAHSTGAGAEPDSAMAQFNRPGAFAAEPLFAGFGPGAYVLALGAVIGSALWFARVRVEDAWLRAIGVVITAADISTISAELAGPDRRMDGGAGMVGVAGSVYVLGQFGAVTTVLVLAGALGVGLILAIDNVMILTAFALREIRRLGLRRGIESIRNSLSVADSYRPEVAAVGAGAPGAGDSGGVAVAEAPVSDSRFGTGDDRFTAAAGTFDPDADFAAGGLSDPSDTVCGDTALHEVLPKDAADAVENDVDRKMWRQAVEEAATIQPGQDIEFSISPDGEIRFSPATGSTPPTEVVQGLPMEDAPVETTTAPAESETVAASTETMDEDARAAAIASDIEAAKSETDTTGAASTEATVEAGSTEVAADGAAGEPTDEDAPRRKRLGLRELLPSGDSFAGVTEPAVAEAGLPTDGATQSAPTDAADVPTTPFEAVTGPVSGDEWPAEAPSFSETTMSEVDASAAAESEADGAFAESDPAAESAPAESAFAGFDAPIAEPKMIELSDGAAEPTDGLKAIAFDEGQFTAGGEPTEAAADAAQAAPAADAAKPEAIEASAAEPATKTTWDSADEWSNPVDTSSSAAFEDVPAAAATNEEFPQVQGSEPAAEATVEAAAAEPSLPSQDRPVESTGDYTLPDFRLLDNVRYRDQSEVEMYVRDQATILESALADFGVNASVVAVETGPVVTMFELDPAPGVKINRITALENDLARALKAPSVRVVAPLPNKDTVGLEVPNAVRDMVRLKELMESRPEAAADMHLPLYLGKDAAGKPLVTDLAGMPHLMIAGTTGSGKSVCINAIIMSILMTRKPDECRLILIDPKIVEMAPYKEIPHLMCPVVNDMKKAEGILEWATAQMEERYSLLAEAGVRNIAAYNRMTDADRAARFNPANEQEMTRIPRRLPYVVLVIDELADLMMTSGKQVETLVTRLAQKSRAVGIHMILATQRPSVDVITGLIKANMPARISFRVAGKVDSRTILDQKGADGLLGQGDMLFMLPGSSKLLRAQGTYISDEEVNRVTAAAAGAPQYTEELVQTGTTETVVGERDELFDEACKIVLESARGSVSLLQRRLNIGYSRAARLIDQMAEAGIVGEYRGSAARDVLMTLQEWEMLTREREGDEQA